MVDYATAMQIIGGNSAPPSTLPEAAPVAAAPMSDFDTKMNILQQGIEGKLPEPQVQESKAPDVNTNDTGNMPTGPLDSFVNKATGMMTFGLNKPVNALGEAGIDYARGKGKFGELYDRRMAQQNNIDRAESAQNPIASGLGNVAGFAGSMATMIPKAGAAVAPAATGAWNTIKGIGATARNNALISAGLGEANAVANTPGSAQEKIASAYPAGVGSAAIGATLPLVAQGVISGGSKVLSPIIDKLTTSDSEAAIAKLAKRFAQDNNITPEQAQSIIENLGSNSSLADAGGANVQKLGKTILNTPGTGANNTVNFLQGRQRGMGNEVQDAIKVGFGNDAEFHDTIANLQAAKQQMAAPLYEKAFSANQDLSSTKLDRLLKTNAGKDALNYAADRMNNKMSLMGVPDADLAEQAQLVGSYQPGGISKGFKLETHDLIKQGFDGQINAGKRQVINGTMKAGELSDIISLKNAYLNELDRLDNTGGAYKQARAAFSNPSQSSDAVEMGRNFMNEDSQMTTKEISKLDPSDKYFFQIGAARAIADKAKANPSSTVKSVLNNDLWKERLKAAMPTESHYYDFLKNAQNISTKSATKNAVLGNSSTASQLKDMADESGQLMKMPYDLNIGNIIDASQGNIKGTLLEIGKHYVNKAMSPKPEVANQLSQMLFSDNPQQNAQTISAWQQYLTKPPSPWTAFGQGAANMGGIQAGRIIQ